MPAVGNSSNLAVQPRKKRHKRPVFHGEGQILQAYQRNRKYAVSPKRAKARFTPPPRLFKVPKVPFPKLPKLKPVPKPAGPYQTPLKPAQEADFRNWVRTFGVPFDPSATKVDYDMRGYFKAHGAVPYQPGQHFPDHYKTPYDTAFSAESKYANNQNPLVWAAPNVLIDRRTGRVILRQR